MKTQNTTSYLRIDYKPSYMKASKNIQVLELQLNYSKDSNRIIWDQFEQVQMLELINRQQHSITVGQFVTRYLRNNWSVKNQQFLSGFTSPASVGDADSIFNIILVMFTKAVHEILESEVFKRDYYVQLRDLKLSNLN